MEKAYTIFCMAIQWCSYIFFSFSLTFFSNLSLINKSKTKQKSPLEFWNSQLGFQLKWLHSLKCWASVTFSSKINQRSLSSDTLGTRPFLCTDISVNSWSSCRQICFKGKSLAWENWCVKKLIFKVWSADGEKEVARTQNISLEFGLPGLFIYLLPKREQTATFFLDKTNNRQ